MARLIRATLRRWQTCSGYSLGCLPTCSGLDRRWKQTNVHLKPPDASERSLSSANCIINTSGSDLRERQGLGTRAEAFFIMSVAPR